MNRRIPGNCSAGAVTCATTITAVSAWTLVQATAAIDRDPFHLAALMEKADAAPRTVTVIGRSVLEEFEDDRPDLLAPAPICLGTCA